MKLKFNTICIGLFGRFKKIIAILHFLSLTDSFRRILRISLPLHLSLHKQSEPGRKRHDIPFDYDSIQRKEEAKLELDEYKTANIWDITLDL